MRLFGISSNSSSVNGSEATNIAFSPRASFILINCVVLVEVFKVEDFPVISG
jgi:hypothetical protein